MSVDNANLCRILCEKCIVYAWILSQYFNKSGIKFIYSRIYSRIYHITPICILFLSNYYVCASFYVIFKQNIMRHIMTDFEIKLSDMIIKRALKCFFLQIILNFSFFFTLHGKIFTTFAT